MGRRMDNEWGLQPTDVANVQLTPDFTLSKLV